ncbi:MAG: hypothetical protein HY903_12910 [Deltaproteobacteria bacterium]|nr:hypothetical protein [Deltaproteobacteria bacterium]
MKRLLAVALSTMSVLAVGLLFLAPVGADTKPTDVVEQQVHANLLRVRINGAWEEFPLMPLADHLCKSPDRLFEKYCGDEINAPFK